jgi:hypothetical protein
MTKRTLSTLAAAFGLLTCAGVARAAPAPRYEVELATGSGRPHGSDDYDDAFSASYKLGVRGLRTLDVGPGDASPWRLAAELAADVTQMDWPKFPGMSLYRVRVLAGARLELRVASGVRVLARGLVGVDHERSSDVYFAAPGEPTGLMTLHERGIALAAELGVGAQVDLGPLVLGVQCGLPVAFYGSVDHIERPDLDDGGGLSGFPPPVARPKPFMSDVAVDVELLATLGMSF